MKQLTALLTWNVQVVFERANSRALAKIQQRLGSMVMAYIDDIVLDTETIEDYLREFEKSLTASVKPISICEPRIVIS